MCYGKPQVEVSIRNNERYRIGIMIDIVFQRFSRFYDNIIIVMLEELPKKLFPLSL